MSTVTEKFGSMVFDESVMKERLPKETFRQLQRTMKDGRSLDINIANVVANAMKDWAIEKGVTHYTHWFQPMTGRTAEKHDSFISPDQDGKVIWYRANRMLLPSLPEDFGQPLRPAGILPGIPLLMRSLKTACFASPLLSAPTAAMLLTKRPLFFAVCRQSTARLCV